MDFHLTEAQQAVREVSAQIFEKRATVERIKEIESSAAPAFDTDLWSDLAAANLLALAVPEADGGSGLGLFELCLVLEQQGRFVAPVPVLATAVAAALPIAAFGSAEQRSRWLSGVAGGDVVLTAALADHGAPVVGVAQGDGWRLRGTRWSVPAAPYADAIVVPFVDEQSATHVAVIDRAALQIEAARTTNREWHGHVHLDDVAVTPDDVLDGATVDWIVARTRVGLCALQVGVAEEAVRRAAEYSSNRQQFGRPLSTFQGAMLKAADAYIDTEAMRVTMWEAAWRLDEGRNASDAVRVAKWWASEGGHRVVHVAQHLHGGLGADVDYPIHRYFLWGKQIEDTLGGAAVQLAELGASIAAAARPGP